MAVGLPETLQLIPISPSIKLELPACLATPDLVIFLTAPARIKQVITGVSGGHLLTKNTDIFLVNVLLLYLLYDET